MLTPGSTYKKMWKTRRQTWFPFGTLFAFTVGFPHLCQHFYGRVNFCKCAPIFAGYPPVNVSMWSLPKMKVDHFPTKNHGKPMGF